MATADLTCWNCGAELPEVPMPVGRGEECPECVAGIRACRMCRFYDADAHNACREPMADLVADKEKSNTCDYFQPRTGGGREDDSEAAESRARLEALFGKKSEGGGGLAEEAAAFSDKQETEVEASRRKLAEMFGKEEE